MRFHRDETYSIIKSFHGAGLGTSLELRESRCMNIRMHAYKANNEMFLYDNLNEYPSHNPEI